ncbi:ParA family protein [Nocardia fusca]|uniref:ParA family protein n=1 Tax=Nocardia fusca TaxID=941183 RepID=UPI0007A7642F|nr:ParA family protein [Nocardia fusca]
MRIYAVANQKGGVGKTVDTINLSATLAEQGRRVFALDWDPQGHLTEAIGARSAEAEQPSPARALLGQWSGEMAARIWRAAGGLASRRDR